MLARHSTSFSADFKSGAFLSHGRTGFVVIGTKFLLYAF